MSDAGRLTGVKASAEGGEIVPGLRLVGADVPVLRLTRTEASWIVEALVYALSCPSDVAPRHHPRSLA
jgi:hypothetical protein